MRTVQSGVIRILFETLKDVLTDTVFMVSKESMVLKQMNSAKTLLVHVKLVPDNFELFHCKNNIQIGINLISIFKFLKPIGNEETITMSVSEDNMDYLDIKIENNVKNTVKICSVNLLSIEEMEDFNVPNIQYDAVMTMPTKDFQNICKNSKNIAKTITIESVDNRIKFISKGDSGKMVTDVGEYDAGAEFKNKGTFPTARGEFRMSSILSISKSSNLCNMVSIFLKDESPLVLLYKIANLGSVKYLICPEEDTD